MNPEKAKKLEAMSSLLSEGKETYAQVHEFMQNGEVLAKAVQTENATYYIVKRTGIRRVPYYEILLHGKAIRLHFVLLEEEA